MLIDEYADVRRANDEAIAGRPAAHLDREPIVLRDDQIPALRHIAAGLAVVLAVLALVAKAAGLSLGVYRL